MSIPNPLSEVPDPPTVAITSPAQETRRVVPSGGPVGTPADERPGRDALFLQIFAGIFAVLLVLLAIVALSIPFLGSQSNALSDHFGVAVGDRVPTHVIWQGQTYDKHTAFTPHALRRQGQWPQQVLGQLPTFAHTAYLLTAHSTTTSERCVYVEQSANLYVQYCRSRSS